MPLSTSKGRLRKAFNEGRRSAAAKASSNPYEQRKAPRTLGEGPRDAEGGGVDHADPCDGTWRDAGCTGAMEAGGRGAGVAAAGRAEARGVAPTGVPRATRRLTGSLKELNHAWFSSEFALRSGSAVYRKPDGSTVNVTRMNLQRDGKSPAGGEEQYVGEVICTEDCGCVTANRRVRGINAE